MFPHEYNSGYDAPFPFTPWRIFPTPAMHVCRQPDYVHCEHLPGVFSLVLLAYMNLQLN